MADDTILSVILARLDKQDEKLQSMSKDITDIKVKQGYVYGFVGAIGFFASMFARKIYEIFFG